MISILINSYPGIGSMLAGQVIGKSGYFQPFLIQIPEDHQLADCRLPISRDT